MTIASRMTERQWERRLIDHARFLAVSALSETLFDEFLQRVHEDYPGHVAMIRYDPNGTMHGAPMACGEVATRLNDYMSHYYRLNPYPAIVARENLGDSTAIFSRYLPRARLWKTEYYDGFLRPLSVEYTIGMSARFPDRSRVSLSIYRDDIEGGEFTDTDVRRLDSLRPHLRNAVMLRRLWRSPASDARDAIALSEELTQPALLVLEDGAVRPLNAAGERYMTAHRGKVSAEAFRKNTATASSCANALGGAYVLPANCLPGGVQLPKHAHLAIITEERRQQVQKLFGLTSREADVTLELLSGLSNREVAERLGITVETCRSYVKNIRQKSGFGSTRRLIASLREFL
jgi:DNA-binding CsgD family transcriptional regulator